MKFNNKFLLLFVLFLVLISSQSFALSWGEQRVIAREVGLKHDFTNFRFAYYEDKVRDGLIYYGEYYNRDVNNEEGVITFYKDSLGLSRERFRCLVLHELGHYWDVRLRVSIIRDNVLNNLNETYADDYMVEHSPECVRFYP